MKTGKWKWPGALVLAGGALAAALILAMVPWSGATGEEAAAKAPSRGGSAFADRVELLAMTCANCHGTDGRLGTGIPPIAGRPEPVLRFQLLAFKEGEMPHATVMPRLVKGYTDEELEALAGYFASLSPEDDSPGKDER